jgi:hypothetical protein
MNYFWGDKFDECIQYTVGKAWKVRTPQALRNAERELQGMYRLLLWTDTGDSVMYLKLMNAQAALVKMAGALERPFVPLTPN